MENSSISNILSLNNSRFRRYTGITRIVFDLMVLIVKEYNLRFKKIEGRPSKLSVEGQVLMLLEFYRENRTFFHLGTVYGLSEGNVHRNIEKIEGIIMGSGYFKLKGNKILRDPEKVSRILVDVTELPAQRPKKKSGTENP
jgi:Helix-turn-helix of DDE superfamily endonuclease